MLYLNENLNFSLGGGRLRFFLFLGGGYPAFSGKRIGFVVKKGKEYETADCADFRGLIMERKDTKQSDLEMRKKLIKKNK